MHRVTIPREQLEELIQHLATTYPKAFFVQPYLKRPLKKNILLDLERDRILDDDRREAALNFYTRDWNYEHTLQAGAKRIDLNGKEVGIVTELEEREALLLQLRAAGVHVMSSAGRLRIAIHGYNTVADIERLFSTLRGAL